MESASIHTAVILVAMILGIGIACVRWTSALSMTTLVTNLGGAIFNITKDRLDVLSGLFGNGVFVESILLFSTWVSGTFLFVLFLGTLSVFGLNVYQGTQANDTDTFGKAGKRAFTFFTTGIYDYVTSNPDAVTAAKIAQMESAQTLLETFLAGVSNEIQLKNHSRQHLQDALYAMGKTILMTAFHESAKLEHYRMAVFLLSSDRKKLEYEVRINSGNWTSHSQNGLDVEGSFAGEALQRDSPLIYPKDKKIWRTPFQKRPNERYKSFVAIPIPCGQGQTSQIGLLTVDSTEKDEVFTASRVEILFNFTRVIHALHSLNVERTGGPNEQAAKDS